MEQLAKNQLHTAEITGYTSDGAGVCHIAGRAVFVKGVLAGETWQVRILKVTANAVYGKAEQCLSPAPARTQPSESVTARLNLRRISSGFSIR